MRLPRTPVVAVLSALALIGGVAAVSSAAGDVVQEHGTVVEVADGDTFFVRTNSGKRLEIRMLGVQAMEVGIRQCGSTAAENLTTSLIPPGSRVRLLSVHQGSTGRQHRPQRYAIARDDKGRFTVDVQEKLLANGLGLFFGDKGETSRSSRYFKVSELARSREAGLWYDRYCGAGPQPNAEISMWVNWDAPGNDGDNPNGEYILIRNDGDQTLNVGGWTLRDSSLQWFRMPRGTRIPAHKWVRVEIGRGGNSATVLHYGNTKPMFPNTGTREFFADGAYLFDPRGNIRSSFTYPCVVDCGSDLKGQVKIKKVVHSPKPAVVRHEKIVLKNTSGTTARLGGTYLRRDKNIYTLRPNTKIKPHKKLTIRMGHGNGNKRTQYWGSPGFLLKRSDTVRFLTLRDEQISCKAWGGERC